MKANQKGMIGVVEGLMIAAVIAVVGFTVFRVVNSDVDVDKSASRESEQSDQLEESIPDDLSTLKSLAEIQAAQAITSDQIVGLELDQEDGRTVFKIQLKDGRVLVVDALSGELVSESNQQPDEDEALPAGFVAGISFEQAHEKALAEYAGSGKVSDIELEVEEGVVVYSVKFSDDSRIEINARDGAIVRVRTENESDDDQGDENSSDDDQGDDSDNSSSGSDDDDSDDSDEEGPDDDSDDDEDENDTEEDDDEDDE